MKVNTANEVSGLFSTNDIESYTCSHHARQVIDEWMPRQMGTDQYDAATV